MKKFLFLTSLVFFGWACNNSAPAPTPAVNNAVSTEAAYQLIVPINDFNPPTNKKMSEEEMQNLAESASDVGFYMMTMEDSLKAMNYQMTEYNSVRDSIKIVEKSGKLVKYVSVKSQMGEECCGFVLAQTGKEPLFVKLSTDLTEAKSKVTEYFK